MASNDTMVRGGRLTELGIVTAADLIAYCTNNNYPNSMNLLIPSTSGVHGSYCTLDDIETNLERGEEDYTPNLTIMIFRPRVLHIIYGTVLVTLGDIPSLRELLSLSEELLCGYFGGNLPREDDDGQRD